MDKEDYMRVSGTITGTTKMALRLMSEHNDVEEWIPKSVCGKMSSRQIDELEKGDSVTLFIATWFVKKRHL
ncbi:hypothetical protein LCGC14_1105670 [marine sediment metagenome]|uniref:Uncharacterized protein n=1 Tax=marine sediment metagenome TaxID=412755 RepID=A0A0F9MCW9_9ZZZZ